MKVKELLQTLKELTESYLEAEEWEVIIYKDFEGNFSSLYDTSIAEYIPHNDRSGEMSSPDDENIEPNTLCLWPAT